MSSAAEITLSSYSNFSDINGRRLVSSILIGLSLTGAVAAIFFVRDRDMLGYATLAIPVLVGVVCHPRTALYQFVFSLFIVQPLSADLPVSLLDASAVLLVMAGGLDLLLRKQAPLTFPRLSVAFFALILALFLAAIFAYDLALGLVHPAKLCFVFVTFLALIRIMRRIDHHEIMKLFFWLSVMHSLLAIGLFASTEGAARNFALAPKALDDILMLALPLGVALFLGAPAKQSPRFALGSIIIFAGLMITQSRAPIAFAALGVALVVWIARRRLRNGIRLSEFELAGSKLLRKRVSALTRISVVVIGVMLLLQSILFTTVYERFGELFTTDPGGTFRLRISLWKAALTAFSDHPIVGVGPSNFRLLENIYPHIHMDPVQILVRGKSAHSLLLHYLAEVGLVGTSAMLVLMVKQMRLAKENWLKSHSLESFGLRLGLYVVGILFLMTAIVEAAWTWGHVSYVAVFFLALSAAYARIATNAPDPKSG